MAIGGTKGLKRTIVNGCGKGWGKEHCMARRRRLDVGVEQTDGKRHDEERTKVCGRVKKGNQWKECLSNNESGLLGGNCDYLQSQYSRGLSLHTSRYTRAKLAIRKRGALSVVHQRYSSGAQESRSPGSGLMTADTTAPHRTRSRTSLRHDTLASLRIQSSRRRGGKYKL